MEELKIDTSNQEFQNALNLIQFTHQSVFLTGKAGTGKSTFLRYVCSVTKKKHVVLAPTGIAAINAGGSTLHSFFKLPFYPLLPDDPKFSPRRIKDFLKYSSSHRKLIDEVELIIIDEISMVRADIIDFIDKVLRIYSRNMRTPFGGKQLLLVGDVYQLEPVVKQDERAILNRFYPTPFFFSARVFGEMELVSIELRKVYRQTDRVFINVLDHIRTNTAGAADLQLLNTRVGAEMSEQSQKMSITLATRRDVVDYINEHKLAELPGEPTVLQGTIKGEFPENSLPTSMELSLKPGAQIIFIKNDKDHRWVNGTIGVVTGFDEEHSTLYVTTETGEDYDVALEQWQNIRYTYNEEEKKIEEEELGTFTQFPLRLAWAITIHKSQGLTFSRVIIDLTGGAFAGGQTYVALSRCTSLDGIQLKKQISQTDIFVNNAIVQFASRFNNRQVYDKAMKQAQADILYRDTVRHFDEGDFEACLDTFFQAIHARYDIERPLVKRFIRRKLGIIRTQRDTIGQLKEELMQKQKMMEKLAAEYCEMGKMCGPQREEQEAALANYSKAIDLAPLYVPGWMGKARTLMDLERYAEAEPCLSHVIKRSRQSAEARLLRGQARLKLNNVTGAVADLDKATTLAPDDADAHQWFGNALAQQGMTDEAELQWELAERLRRQQGGKPKGNNKRKKNS